ncbi:MAG: hypothetical protein GX859_02250 [Corynebacterium humireducens]|jgi:hypothetical protein|uniref:Uncharacterized protein n=1 Tax=Corynebacterium humireducens TaxID=1223514 RepID=A0A7X6SV60_9CORY|nr:hypothetical protein [Corynebacterium humireducens]
MTVRIRIRGGRELTGETVPDAIRDAYGPTAEFWPNRDPNGPEAGMIVSPVPYEDLGAYNIHATVLWIDHHP